ncbi:MAG: hypothetical protein V3S80_04855 [Sulfurimonadaceae bacterium]
MKKIIRLVALAAMTGTMAIAGGDVEPVPVEQVIPVENGEWKQSLSIYGWLPSFSGTLNYNIPGEGDDPDRTGESSILDNIDGVFMGTYEVSKNKWSFLGDVIYLKMSDSQEGSISLPPILDRPSLQIGSDQELTLWLVSVYGGYNTVNNDNVTLDIIAGMRYLSLDTDVSFTLGSQDFNISPSAELYDAVIGVKGAVNLNENWYLPYLFDIGGGDSDLTWQASAGLGYRFGWGDVLLTYRYIYYDEGNSDLLKELEAYGPKLGVVFHF